MKILLPNMEIENFLQNQNIISPLNANPKNFMFSGFSMNYKTQISQPIEKFGIETPELKRNDIIKFFREDFFKDIYKTLKTIPIPERFNFEEVYNKLLSDYSKPDKIDEIKADTFIAYSKLENSTKISNFLENAWDLVIHESERVLIIENELMHVYKNSIQLFLDSDLPPSFLRIMTAEVFLEIILSKSFDSEIKNFKRKISQKYDKIDKENFIKSKISRYDFDNAFRKYIRNRDKIHEVGFEVATKRDSLILFLDIWNSEKLKDINNLKKIQVKNINVDVFDELLDNLDNKTKELMNFLSINYSDILNKTKLISVDKELFNDFITTTLLETKVGT